MSFITFLFNLVNNLGVPSLFTGITSDIETEDFEDFQKNQTQEIIVSFLLRCGIPYPAITLDSDFKAASYAEAERLGYALEPLRSFIPGGVAMATTAYSHLPKSTQLFISLYTAFLIYLDDIFQHDVGAVLEFNERFLSRRPQKDGVLDDFAALLSDTQLYFGRIASNIIVTSTLNLVTALLIEYETEGFPLCQFAQRYPTFSRVMSGASEAYGLFMFPRELPLETYIQALPEIMVYINNGNDILSFYKEESAGETVNRVSLIAESQSISKHEALRFLSDEAVEAHERVLDILAPHRGSYEAYTRFSRGYIGFHASLSRYRLKELNL